MTRVAGTIARRTLPALFAALALYACDGGANEHTALASGARIRRPLELAPQDVRAVGLELPARDERWLYVVDEQGVWRCANAEDAIARPKAVGGLVLDLVRATGLPREVPAERRPAYGLGEDAPRVVLFGAGFATGADRSALAEILLGEDVEGRRAWIAPEGGAVWEIDRTPRARFAQPAHDRLPPMLDRRLLAGEQPDPGEGFTRAFLDFADGRSRELRRVGAAGTWSWELHAPGEEPVPVLPYRIAGWQSFIYRAPYAGFAAASEAERLGVTDPWLTITLVDARGAIELAVAEPRERGPLAVRNARNGMLVLLAPEHAERLVPSDADLLDRGRANPWEEWLGGAAVRR